MTDLAHMTPRQAVAEMVLAGARFSVRQREDALGLSFWYTPEPGSDRERLRAILAAVEARPSPFFGAFKAEVQRVASETAEAQP